MQLKYGKNENAMIGDVFVPAKIVQHIHLLKELSENEFNLMSYVLRTADGIMLAKFPELSNKNKDKDSKELYDLIVEHFPEKYKIYFIKKFREFNECGLVEAKIICEKLPCLFKSCINIYEAERIKFLLNEDCPGIEVTFEKNML